MNSSALELQSERADFYVYAIHRPDGTPCYVGKGRRDRWKAHAKAATNQRLRRIYAKHGPELPVSMVWTGLTERDAHALEIETIGLIGRTIHGGTLVNDTDGGDGTAGHIHHNPPETRERIRQAKLGKPRDDATKAKLRAALLGRKLTPEHVAKVSAGLKASPKMAAHIEALAAKSKGRPLSPEHRAKLSAATTAQHARRRALKDQ